jgi:hypothetical protein
MSFPSRTPPPSLSSPSPYFLLGRPPWPFLSQLLTGDWCWKRRPATGVGSEGRRLSTETELVTLRPSMAEAATTRMDRAEGGTRRGCGHADGGEEEILGMGWGRGVYRCRRRRRLRGWGAGHRHRRQTCQWWKLEGCPGAAAYRRRPWFERAVWRGGHRSWW